MRRRHAGRQPRRRAVEEFEHARARPVDVGAVLEDDVDERDAEEREAAHHLRFRHRQHRRRQRIGDLVLDHLRRLAGIFGVDDDLRVGEVGNGVERQMEQRVEAGRRGKAGAEQHQQQVARRPGDEAGDHCWRSRSRKALQRRLQIAFGVDQEVGGDDDRLAFGDAVADFDIAAAAMAELDLARLEPALALVDEDGLPAAAVDAPRCPERPAHGSPLPVSISASTYMSCKQHQVGIWQFDANARRARFLVDLGIDDLDLSGELAPGKAPGPHGDRLPLGDHAEIALGDIDQRPHHGMVGDPEQHVAGLDAHALDRVALEHDAVARGRPFDRGRNVAAFLDGRRSPPPARRGSSAAAREPRP